MANLNEAYDGLGTGFDKRQRCCGTEFYSPALVISVGRKQVNVAVIKGILERNKSLASMGSTPNAPIWTELGLTQEEYQFVLKKYRKMTQSRS